MRIRLLFSFLLLTGAVAFSPALATERFCIEFEGIPGSARNSACQSTATDGYEFHHLAAREMQSGVPGQLRHHLIIFTKRWDKATTNLWDRMDSSTAIPTVTFRFGLGEGGGGTSVNARFTITLTNARVIGIEPIVSHVNDPDSSLFQNQSRVRMDYQTMAMQHEGDPEYTITP